MAGQNKKITTKNDKLPLPEYGKEEILKLYQDFADYLLDFNDFEEARLQLKFIPNAIKHQSPDLPTKKPELWHGYEKVLFKLKAICLMFLADKEIVELLRTRAADLLKLPGYNLADKLKAKLVRIWISDRDAYKLELRQALEACKQFLTEEKITVAGQQQEPSVSNWLKDYIRAIGTGPAESLKKAEFFTENPNVKRLNKEEKKVLTDLINIYERLKLSSNEPEGLEEVISFSEGEKHFVMREGRIEEIKPDPLLVKIQAMQTEERLSLGETESYSSAKAMEDKEEGETEESLGEPEEKTVSPQAKQQALIDKYHQSVTELFENEKVKSHLQNLQNAKAIDIVKNLESASDKKDKDSALACLASLISKGQFTFLEQASVYKEWQAGFLKNHPGIEAVNLTNKEQREILSGQFIKALLTDKLGLESQQSSMAGMHLAKQLLKEQGQKNYLNMAYADLKSSLFKWREVVVEDGRLKYR